MHLSLTHTHFMHISHFSNEQKSTLLVKQETINQTKRVN